MKYLIHRLFALSLIFFIISSGEDQNSVYGQNNDPASQKAATHSTNNKEEKLKYFALKDETLNIPVIYNPLPAFWNEKGTGRGEFTGPGGIELTNRLKKVYHYSYVPMMNYFAQDPAMGELRQPVSAEYYIQNEIIPALQQEGFTVVKMYSVPQIASWFLQFDEMNFSPVPSQKNFESWAIELRDQNGNPQLELVNYQLHHSEASDIWYVNSGRLKSSKAAFESAKIAYFNGLINARVNPEWLKIVNERGYQKAMVSTQQHRQRMAQQQAMADAGTRRHKANMDAMDQRMDSWRERQRIQDQGHQNYINSIHERTEVTDPNTGQTYQVQSGANQYWGNGSGEYIMSNDLFYNPNMDKNINNQNWVEYQEKR